MIIAEIPAFGWLMSRTADAGIAALDLDRRHFRPVIACKTFRLTPASSRETLLQTAGGFSHLTDVAKSVKSVTLTDFSTKNGLTP